MAILTINPAYINENQQEFDLIGNAKLSSASSTNVIVDRGKIISSNLPIVYNPFKQCYVEFDPSQAWFWSEEWLNDELNAETEIANGDFTVYDDIDDFLASL